MSEKLNPFPVGPLGKIDWCEINSKENCPYGSSKGGKKSCGISIRLRQIPRRERKREEAESLWNLAQVDPEKFHQFCVNAIFSPRS